VSESLEVLRRKISSAEDLGSVVRTMKVLAATSIFQYEQAVHSLSDYYHAIELGLNVCLRPTVSPRPITGDSSPPVKTVTKAIVFGSDQGLVGQFNDHLTAFVLNALKVAPGDKLILAVGERICGRLEDAGFSVSKLYSVPNSVAAITPLVSQILIDQEENHEKRETYIFHNRPASGQNYEPVKQRLLPLDDTWQAAYAQLQWPTKLLPEVLGSVESTVLALVHEYLFVSLFKATAESLASENACRLAAMQRAQRNIDDLLDRLRTTFHQTRQTSIDEELFDVISGFEALSGGER